MALLLCTIYNFINLKLYIIYKIPRKLGKVLDKKTWQCYNKITK